MITIALLMGFWLTPTHPMTPSEFDSISCYVCEDFWPLNTALWVKGFRCVTPLFALFLLRSLDLKQYNGGASAPTLDRKTVHRIEILVPPEGLLESFDEFSQPAFDQVQKLTLQNQKLRTARDLLLPKLMSGEIEV